MTALMKAEPVITRKPVGELKVGDRLKLDEHEPPKVVIGIEQRGSAWWVFLRHGAFTTKRVLRKTRVVEVVT